MQGDHVQGASGKSGAATQAQNSKRSTLRFEDREDQAKAAAGHRTAHNVSTDKDHCESSDDQAAARTPKVGGADLRVGHEASGKLSPTNAPPGKRNAAAMRAEGADAALADLDADGLTRPSQQYHIRPPGRGPTKGRLTSTDL